MQLSAVRTSISTLGSTLGLALGLVAAPAGAHAQGDVSAGLRTSAYVDDDATFISTSTASVQGAVTDELTLRGRYLADVVTSASVDVITAATGRWNEIRHEAEGATSWTDSTRSLSGQYIYSVEADWESHTATGGASHDFNQHNLTLALGGSYVHNRIGRADDANFHRRLSVYGGSASAVVVAGPRDIWRLGYTVSLSDGYQASPYRFARFEDSLAPEGLPLAQEETHPQTRLRHAVTLAWNHKAFEATFVRSHLRMYADDWGLLSLTGGAEYDVVFGPVTVGGIARGYAQQGASFYEDLYPSRRRYMTADRELSSFFDVFAGGKIGLQRSLHGVIERIRVEVEVVGFGFWFPSFSELPRRLGVVSELGVGLEF
jgi:hypothetical protein